MSDLGKDNRTPPQSQGGEGLRRAGWWGFSGRPRPYTTVPAVEVAETPNPLDGTLLDEGLSARGTPE